MIQILIYLKKRLPVLWRFIELSNGLLFRVLYYKRIKANALKTIAKFKHEKYVIQLLNRNDLENLLFFFSKQNQDQFNFFKPHEFDKKTLIRLLRNSSFLMFGVFDKEELVGYFFLRCFINKKSFIGRMVDNNYQGQGLGKLMGKILYNVAWSSKFRVYSTISINNVASFESHKANKNLKIVRELSNDFYLVEFINIKE